MMKRYQKTTKIPKLCFSFFLIAIMVISGMNFQPNRKVHAAATMKGYTIGTSNTRVYSNSGLTTGMGWIYPSDEVIIREVTNQYCYVTYPVTGGTKSGYIATGAILLSNSGISKTATATVTTYRRANSNQTYGYVAKGDSVLVLGTRGSYTQIRYPVSGGYKFAFISTANANRYLSSNSSSSNNRSSNSRTTAAVSNGWYYIKSAINSNYVLDIAGGSSYAGANLQIYGKNNSSAQMFYLERNSAGYYTLTAKCSGMNVDVWQNYKYNGCNVVQSTKHGGANQQWKIYKTSDGCYSFQSRSNSFFPFLLGCSKKPAGFTKQSAICTWLFFF